MFMSVWGWVFCNQSKFDYCSCKIILCYKAGQFGWISHLHWQAAGVISAWSEYNSVYMCLGANKSDAPSMQPSASNVDVQLEILAVGDSLGHLESWRR